ncbi:TlpA family protein disulfide reductase [Pedobacter hiemivivus]|uniref:TlpA family protein disulfide reductase n=2 Tax=Pedobacter hiemivivus TaxID=2530454 RepID=A0A4V2MID6_9SPHI|nr:TlpA family protein disulfide reductase [Pedobacter hiemivivus]
MESYGIDSLAIVRLHQLMEEKHDDSSIDSAYKKAFVKKLSDKEQVKLSRFVEENAALNDEALFKRSVAYRNWLDGYVTKLSATKYKEDSIVEYGVVKIKVINSEISNPFIKEYMNYRATGFIIKMAKDKDVRANAFRGFMATATIPHYKAEIEEMYANDKMMSEQGAAPDFTYPNVDGRSISLKDLLGKYVYIDIWATWCAPCKAEIPFLTKLEEDYHDRNIHFVSLSVDRMADKAKWISYVKDHQLQGIQLIADKDFKSDFVKKFNVNSIPRFILIDPTGKIVSGDAKRPSDPALRKQLDSLLK